MPSFLGIDTSNYTTSVALVRDGKVEANIRLPLLVAPGEKGLRQSDAVFLHTKQLPGAFAILGKTKIDAVGVSSVPRDAPGSYMPCFLAGVSAAEAISNVNGIPLYSFSHQSGHFAAAAYSAGVPELIDGECIAFHLSGGTTEIVLWKKGKADRIGGTNDLTAGQAIDRIGVLLGFPFPCGGAMEHTAESGNVSEKISPSVCGLSCNLSGIENLAKRKISSGESKENVASFVLAFIGETIDRLSENVRALYDLPILYAGGVMRNAAFRKKLGKRGNTYFALPDFSSDNAAGAALLAERRFIEKE